MEAKERQEQSPSGKEAQDLLADQRELGLSGTRGEKHSEKQSRKAGDVR